MRIIFSKIKRTQHHKKKSLSKKGQIRRKNDRGGILIEI
jgi:hypothetical protein